MKIDLVLYALHYLNTLPVLSHLIIATTLLGGHYYYPHFIDEMTEHRKIKYLPKVMW